MGRVKSWVMDMEDDVWELDREQWIEKHGISNVDIYDRVEKVKNSEFNFVAMEQAFYRFLKGEKR